MKNAFVLVVLVNLFTISSVFAQDDGERLYELYCAMCHNTPLAENIPPRQVLEQMNPQPVVDSMTHGKMQLQAQALSAEQKVLVAEFVTGKQLSAQPMASVNNANHCKENLSIDLNNAKAGWNGWGSNPQNHRFQKSENKITPANVGKLKLKWAYGFADADHAQSQPAIIDDKLFISSQTGEIHALNAKSGCTYWTFKADAGARNAMSLAEGIVAGQIPRPMLFFADAATNVYALDAETGQLYWKLKVGDHPAASATGSPIYHNNRLYVVLAGVAEEISAADPNYECCTFRGSITAIDVNNGAVVWKQHTLPEPQKREKNQIGTQLWGPAGVAIWSAPTVDAKRNLIYVGTGNSFADPAADTSDAILAFDLTTGKIRWSKQISKDVWILNCPADGYKDNKNCPKELGPDMDFSASPILATTKDGKDLLLATQKSGMGYALDPDNNGEIVWQYKWGQGSGAGGVYGAAIDDNNVYFAVADLFAPNPGGLKAVDIATGKEVWAAPPQEKVCDVKEPTCNSAQSSAVSVIPGVVFSASMDGGIRAYDAKTGKVLWVYNTNREFDTINGVKAQGGSISGPGQVVVDGMLYVSSGNGGLFGRAGNVLLVFEISE